MTVRMSSALSLFETTQPWSEWNAKLIMCFILVRFHAVKNPCALQAHYTSRRVKGRVSESWRRICVWVGMQKKPTFCFFHPAVMSSAETSWTQGSFTEPSSRHTHQTSRLHGNCNLRGMWVPFSLVCHFSEDRVWVCVCVCTVHTHVCK